jgi:hypothetical protein
MNKDDFENTGDEQLLKRIREAEQDFIQGLEPNPAVKANLRRQFAAPVPLWKKSVPAWAAAAAVLLFLVPALLLWMNRTTAPEVLVKVQTDTVRLRDTLRIVEYREKENTAPAKQPVQHIRNNSSVAVQTHQPVNAKSIPDFELKAAMLGVKKLPESIAAGGFTLADDTTYKNFVVTFRP